MLDTRGSRRQQVPLGNGFEVANESVDAIDALGMCADDEFPPIVMNGHGAPRAAHLGKSEKDLVLALTSQDRTYTPQHIVGKVHLWKKINPTQRKNVKAI